MNFRRSLTLSIVAIGLVAASAAAAKPKDSRDIVLHHDATVAGLRLTSGDYNVTWKTHSPEATVTFMQGKKVVATADGKVVDRGKPYDINEVVYRTGAGGDRQIQEIRFRGSSQVIVFGE